MQTKKLQIDMPDNLNLELKRYKMKHDFSSMSDAIIKILEEKFIQKGVKKKK